MRPDRLRRTAVASPRYVGAAVLAVAAASCAGKAPPPAPPVGPASPSAPAWNVAPAAFPVPPTQAVKVARLKTLLASYERRSFAFPGHPEEPLGYGLLAPPDAEPGRRYPLIVYFHSRGAQGTDGVGPMHALATTELFLPDYQRAHPDRKAFVCVPQIPSRRDQYGHYPDGKDKPSTWPNDAVPALVDELVRTLPIDPDRVYAVGLSMGGVGVWDALVKYPGKFAAGVPIAGSGQLAEVPRLLDTPIWAFINRDDQVMPAAGPRWPNDPANAYFGQRDLMRALARLGSPVLFTEPAEPGGARRLPAPSQRHAYTEYLAPALPDNPHAVELQALNEPALPSWLFAQRRRR